VATAEANKKRFYRTKPIAACGIAGECGKSRHSPGLIPTIALVAVRHSAHLNSN